jgi:hypothetical protein
MRVKALTAAEKRCRPKKQNHAIKRITPQEEEFIAANWGAMTPNEIARAIGRHRESVRYVARRLGLTPIGRPCKARRAAAASWRRVIDRTALIAIAGTVAEIRRLCKAIGIPVDDVPLITLARTLKRHHGWRPRNIHVAADLGDDGCSRRDRRVSRARRCRVRWSGWRRMRRGLSVGRKFGARGIGGISVKLRAPFPWFGGKSAVASVVWQRFGDVRNYVEPFAGSLAVLLGRPHWPWEGNRIETVNDADCFLANFWRALQADPEGVARHCDWPVNEADLHARHLWLVNVAREHVERCRTEPEYFDSKIAGWWVWGCCQWIGSGWCHHPSLRCPAAPHLGDAGRGVHRSFPTSAMRGGVFTGRARNSPTSAMRGGVNSMTTSPCSPPDSAACVFAAAIGHASVVPRQPYNKG